MVPHRVPQQHISERGTAQGSQRGAGLLWCCWAGISRMMTWHGWAVPLHHRAPWHPWQEPSRRGDPEGSPLSGNDNFSHCPQMFGFLPAISAHPSLPPSSPPALLRTRTSRASSAAVGASLCSRHRCCPACPAGQPLGQDDLATRPGQCRSGGGRENPPGTRRCWGCARSRFGTGEQGGGKPHGASSA